MMAIVQVAGDIGAPIARGEHRRVSGCVYPPVGLRAAQQQGAHSSVSRTSASASGASTIASWPVASSRHDQGSPSAMKPLTRSRYTSSGA
jgi:hypothetical protein